MSAAVSSNIKAWHFVLFCFILPLDMMKLNSWRQEMSLMSGTQSQPKIHDGSH